MIFIDMDGVIAYHCYKDYLGEKPEYLYTNYFSTLKEDPYIISLLKQLQALDHPFVFLSKTPEPGTYHDIDSSDESDYAAIHKRSWLDKVGFKNVKLLTTSKSKVETAELYLGRKISAKDCLLDDYNPNLEEWSKSGGYPIKYINGSNSSGTGPGEELRTGTDLVRAIDILISSRDKQ